MEIARETGNNGIFQKEIAARQRLSIKYLDQIIQALKSAGLISNVHGKKSGYILAKPAAQITILDLYKAFEPDICIVDCIASSYQCEKETFCAAKPFWLGLNSLIINYFQSCTLADLLNKQINLENLAGISIHQK